MDPKPFLKEYADKSRTLTLDDMPRAWSVPEKITPDDLEWLNANSNVRWIYIPPPVADGNAPDSYN